MNADAPGFFRGKHVVVFGAGYVGGAVVHEALAQGGRVTALTRNVERASALAAAGADVVMDDLASSLWHTKIQGGADFVLNAVGSGGGGLEGYRHSYVDGMQSILAWASSRGGVGTLAYTSSTSVYPQSGGGRVDEDAPTGGGDAPAQVLLQAEDLLRASTGAAARWFILRLAGIYGPGRHHLLDQLRAGAPELGGRGEAALNLAHRDDIVAAILAAFAAPAAVANEVFNVADDGAVRKAELVSWLAEKLGRPAPIFSGRPVPGRRAVTPDRIILNAKLKRLLGWRPRYPDYRAGYAPLLEA